jgi:hypothetical protein
MDWIWKILNILVLIKKEHIINIFTDESLLVNKTFYFYFDMAIIKALIFIGWLLYGLLIYNPWPVKRVKSVVIYIYAYNINFYI